MTKTTASKDSTSATRKAGETKAAKAAKAAKKTVGKAAGSSTKASRSTRAKAGKTTRAGKAAKKTSGAGKTAPVARPAQLARTAPRPVAASTPVVHKDPKLANNWKEKAVEDLTDQEILAMPDDAYMNDTQRAFFRLKLTNLRDGILAKANSTAARLQKDTVVVPDPADRATIEEEHALELRTRDRERKLLKKIEQAISRIDAGDYGYCDESGEIIGVARLLARPTATLSLEAQERREHTRKMFGD